MTDVIAGTSTRYTEIQQLSYTTVCVCVCIFKILNRALQVQTERVQIEFH